MKSRTRARFSPVPMAASRSINWTRGYLRKADNPFFKIVKLERLFFALYQLNNFAAHKVDRGDQHGHLIGMPAAANFCLSSETCVTP